MLPASFLETCIVCVVKEPQSGEGMPAGVPRIVDLVRHLYRPTGRPLRGGGDSLHFNQIQVNYHDAQRYTSFVNIAEGDDDAQEHKW